MKIIKALPKIIGVLLKKWNSPNIRLFSAMFIVVLGIYSFLSAVSFLFSYEKDFSLLFTRYSLKNLPEPPNNIGGYLGLIVVKLFIINMFGVIGIIIPVIITWAGVGRILAKARKLLVKVLPSLIFLLFWLSFLMGFISSLFDLNSILWAGAIGTFLIEKTSLLVGSIGSLLIILITLVIYAVYLLKNYPSLAYKLFPFITLLEPYLETTYKETAKDFTPEPQSSANNNVATVNEDSEDDVFRVIEVHKTPAEAPINDNNNPTTIVKREQEKKPETFIKTPEKKEEEFTIEIAEEKDTPYIPYEDNTIKVTPKTLTVKVDEEHQQTLGDSETLEDFNPRKILPGYQFPTLELLDDYQTVNIELEKEEVEQNKQRIIQTLQDYGIKIEKIKATIGPTITLYEVVPAKGIKVSKIKNLEDDIALRLAATGIRIIAPMPGRGTIGIEIPNKNPQIVSLKNILATQAFKNMKGELPLAIGRTISNEVFMIDLAKLPHLLIAGATGQGKSVGINCMIASLLYKKHPAEVKFVLIDPKKVEMSLYKKIENHYLAVLPNLDEPIITDVSKVKSVLTSLTKEMDDRYKLLKKAYCRNIKEYNEKFRKRKLDTNKGHRFLPYIVVVIDELADLMMVAGKEVEHPIGRLAQLARAVGIHLIVATQRPSVNVITGTIKANFPARLSYRVISVHDSKTILDMPGAEKLVGRGDLLYFAGVKIERVQNAYISTEEVERIVDYIARQPAFPQPYFLPEVEMEDETIDLSEENWDELLPEIARTVVRTQQGSTSFIQRKFSVGYNRAGRITDQLEILGIVGPSRGSKPRKVLIQDETTLEQILKSKGIT